MNAIKSLINYIVLIIVLLILVIVPLPYGSVETWAKLLFQLESFFLLFLLIIYLFLNDNNLKLQAGYSKFFILAFFILVIVQMLPMPAPLLKILSYESYYIWLTNEKVLSQVGYSQLKSLYTISLYPYGTFTGLLQLLAYFSFGIVIAFFCNNKKRITYLIYTIFLIAFIEASIGLYQSVFLGERTTGTYVNRNHFAGFIELTSFLMIGYALSLRDYGSADKGLRIYFRDLLSSDMIFKQLTMILVISFVAISLFLSESRMGIFSFLITAVLMYLIINRISKKSPAERILIGFTVFMTICYVIFISFYPIFKRFVETVGDSPGRAHIWKDSFRIFLDFPLFGTGLNTYGFVIAKYKTLNVPYSINFAHNDYLQLLVETGVIGFILLIIPLYKLIRYSLEKIRNYSNRKDYFAAYVRLGALCGIISILVHSLVDFNLHIPANAVYFSFLIGLIFSDFDGGDANEDESGGNVHY